MLMRITLFDCFAALSASPVPAQTIPQATLKPAGKNATLRGSQGDCTPGGDKRFADNLCRGQVYTGLFFIVKAAAALPTLFARRSPAQPIN